jgi:hypothetical protein
MVTVISEMFDFQPYRRQQLVSPEDTEFVVITNSLRRKWEGPGPDPCPNDHKKGIIATIAEAEDWSQGFTPYQKAAFRVRFICIDYAQPQKAMRWLNYNLCDLTYADAMAVVAPPCPLSLSQLSIG